MQSSFKTYNLMVNMFTERLDFFLTSFSRKTVNTNGEGNFRMEAKQKDMQEIFKICLTGSVYFELNQKVTSYHQRELTAWSFW